MVSTRHKGFFFLSSRIALKKIDGLRTSVEIIGGNRTKVRKIFRTNIFFL